MLPLSSPATTAAALDACAGAAAAAPEVAGADTTDVLSCSHSVTISRAAPKSLPADVKVAFERANEKRCRTRGGLSTCSIPALLELVLVLVLALVMMMMMMVDDDADGDG